MRLQACNLIRLVQPPAAGLCGVAPSVVPVTGRCMQATAVHMPEPQYGSPYMTPAKGLLASAGAKCQ